MFIVQTDTLRDDSELCTLPFTHDFPENPLRCTQGLSTDSMHLLHALLAFSLQHVSRLRDGSSDASLINQINTYKYTATEIYTATSLFATNAARERLFDTIVVLFAFDVGTLEQHS